MNTTFNDFVMESAMIENTNDTGVNDIEMEQWNAEFNVACAAFDAFNKYSLIAEYAQCDVEEFVQESLDDKINKVEDWKNSGGKAKKILGTIAAGALKVFRAVANFFKNLFSKNNNPFRKLGNYLKSHSKKSYRNAAENAAKENEKLKGELAEEKATRNKLANEGVELNRKLKAVMKEAKKYKTLYQNMQQSSAKALEEARAIAKSKGADVERLQGNVIEHINKFNEALELIKKNAAFRNNGKDLKAEDKAFIDKYDSKEDNSGKAPTMDEVAEVLFAAAEASEASTENINKVSDLMPDIKDIIEKDPAKAKTTFAEVQSTGTELNNVGKKTVADMRAEMESMFKGIAV